MEMSLIRNMVCHLSQNGVRLDMFVWSMVNRGFCDRLSSALQSCAKTGMGMIPKHLCTWRIVWSQIFIATYRYRKQKIGLRLHDLISGVARKEICNLIAIVPCRGEVRANVSKMFSLCDIRVFWELGHEHENNQQWSRKIVQKDEQHVGKTAREFQVARGAVVVEINRFDAQQDLGVRLSCTPLANQVQNQDQSTTWR